MRSIARAAARASLCSRHLSGQGSAPAAILRKACAAGLSPEVNSGFNVSSAGSALAFGTCHLPENTYPGVCSSSITQQFWQFHARPFDRQTSVLSVIDSGMIAVERWTDFHLHTVR